jgi:hypothetical protein
MVKIRIKSMYNRIRREVTMYAEKYILEDIERRNLSLDKIKEETGIDVAVLMEEGQELTALDFLNLCIYLRISPEDIRDSMFLNR